MQFNTVSMLRTQRVPAAAHALPGAKQPAASLVSPHPMAAGLSATLAIAVRQQPTRAHATSPASTLQPHYGARHPPGLLRTKDGKPCSVVSAKKPSVPMATSWLGAAAATTELMTDSQSVYTARMSDDMQPAGGMPYRACRTKHGQGVRRGWS